MGRISSKRSLRFIALSLIGTAAAVTAGLAVSYARPFGTAGYGSYGNAGVTTPISPAAGR